VTSEVELTDQRIAGHPAKAAGPVARAIGPHLNNWICLFGSKSIFDFAELIQGYDPDRSHLRTWPPGQMLEGVKLQRARGGCLGAKSR
jgi:hypothetical protein